MSEATVSSLKAFRYLWFNWRVIGMHPPQRFKELYRAYAIFITIFSTIGLPMTMAVKIYQTDDFERLVANLSISLTVFVITFKQFYIYLYRDKLARVGDYLNRLDERSARYADERRQIVWGVRASYVFYGIFMVMYGMLCSGYLVLSFTHLQPIYDGWYPEYFEDPRTNLYIGLVYQNYCILSVFVWSNGSNDSYPLCYMSIMIAQLRALKLRLGRIGKNDQLTPEENRQELVECIYDHKYVLGYFDCIRPVISKTVAFQFLITGVVLCLTTLNIFAFKRDHMQMFFSGLYFVAVAIEILPCCYLGNMLYQESNDLTTALYSCGWYTQNLKYRREMIIFMQRTQKTQVIVAGDLMPVTLQTFLQIIKFAFSFFTLLQRMNIH